ncbi:MAG: FAD-dependent oxidoreductase [Beijerinckiaceae bacterium]
MTEATFRFEGRTIPFRPGQSIAAALAAAGEHELRETADGTQRGIFCGMGVCQECLVAIDGVPGNRACMTSASANSDVRRQAYPGQLPAATAGAPPLSYEDLPAETADLLVIGGGAGGLAAAAHAARVGLSVILLDERATQGGQYYKQAAAKLSAAPLDPQQAEGARLVAQAQEAGLDIRMGVEAWGPAEPLGGAPGVLATGPGGTRTIHGRRVIVASGAHERPLMIPGWTLPGVMTTGALQTLWRSYRALPGKRILIAGNGPLNLQVALEAKDAGATIVGIVEAADVLSPGRLGAAASMWAADAALARKGLGMLARAKLSGLPMRFGKVLRAIRQVDGGIVADISRLDGSGKESFTADIVAMGYGFQPSAELLRAFGAAQEPDPRNGLIRTARSETCETSVSGLFAVGDCAGPGGAPAALAEGVIAAAAVAASLGRTTASEAVEAACRDLASARRFQDALWRLYAARWPGLALADTDTLVCRCENVSRGALDAALAEGGGIGDVKRRTRCGMGRCQGRYCGPALAHHIAETRGVAIAEDGFFAPRFPVKPVRIADIVGGRGGG